MKKKFVLKEETSKSLKIWSKENQMEPEEITEGLAIKRDSIKFFNKKKENN